jgi:DNA-binding transcriptional LysR family regulator
LANALADLNQRPFSNFQFSFTQTLVSLVAGSAMEMKQVRYFLALCKERNFTRAAERCGIKQPSLTKAIKSLESKLGGALFYRSQSETQLTELGRLVYPRMRRIDKEAAYAQQIAKTIKVRKSS